MLLLFAAALLWIGLHRGVAGSSARGWLVQRLGAGGYRGLFALLSVGSLAFLISSYRSAPTLALWSVPRAALRVPSFLMPLAFTLLAGAFTSPNPTAVGGERALRGAPVTKGVQRITRHPFLWAVALWAGTHLLVNGRLESVLFFGSLLLSALVGTSDIDRKRARSNPAEFEAYRAVTSNAPFVAILTGRNRLAMSELIIPGALGGVLSAVFLAYHDYLFGVSALP